MLGNFVIWNQLWIDIWPYFIFQKSEYKFTLLFIHTNPVKLNNVYDIGRADKTCLTSRLGARGVVTSVWFFNEYVSILDKCLKWIDVSCIVYNPSEISMFSLPKSPYFFIVYINHVTSCDVGRNTVWGIALQQLLAMVGGVFYLPGGWLSPDKGHAF